MTGTGCVQCGRPLGASEQWCGLCFTPAPDARFSAPTPAHRPDDRPPAEAVRYGYSRWAGSSVSFGPLGRVLLTLVLLAGGPFVAFPLGGWIALTAWVVVLLPWALRDVWRRVRVRR